MRTREELQADQEAINKEREHLDNVDNVINLDSVKGLYIAASYPSNDADDDDDDDSWDDEMEFVLEPSDPAFAGVIAVLKSI